MTQVRNSPDLERRAKAAFDAVIELPAEHRPARLDSICADDAALRDRVRALLASHDHAENFLQPPPPLFGFNPDAAAKAADSALIGVRIGRYRIVREIAAGGMGVVYEAEQDQPRRTVALKVMRAGLASRAMLRRFEHEAEVLGHLQHPGIAQVYEAGTFDLGHGAQPYFAMEFVRGRSLLEYCDAHALAAPRRLELLARICDAVHYAHQKGVVHRDLKPDNILVSEDIDAPEHERREANAPSSAAVDAMLSLPKILDFGVARAVDSDIAVTTMQTDIGQLIGTLPYMSPEQVAADPSEVDTRSDVYALGVIGYELLTGKTPLDVRHKSVAEAARIIADADAPSLTQFNRVFRGDVSTIFAKALEKDKQRRYQSASDLGEDIRRFLRHEPITARPATTLYQLQKFARRHRALVAGVLGVFLMLVLGVIGTSVGLFQAKSAAKEAKHQEGVATAAAAEAQIQRANAEQVSRFLQRMLASINPRTALGRDTSLLREILDTAASRVTSELADQPLVASTLEAVIGRAYRSLSLYEQAQQHLDRALELRRANLPADSDEIAESMGDLGMLLLERGRYADAKPLLAGALDMATRMHGPNHIGAAMCMANMGVYCTRVGEFAEGERLHREAVRILKSLLPENDSRLIMATVDLAVVLHSRHKYAETEDLYAVILAQRERTSPVDSPDIAGALMNLASVQSDQGHYDSAKTLLTRALAIYRKVMPDNHDSIASALLNLARIAFAQEDYDTTADELRQAMDIYHRAFGPEHPTVARCLEAMSNLALGRRDLPEAERLCQQALDMRRKLLSADNPDIARSLDQLASIRNRQGRPDESADLLRQSLAIHRALGPGDFGAASALINLGTYERLRHHLPEAESLLREALDMNLRLLGDEHMAVESSRSRLAMVLEEEGRHEEALPLRMRSLEYHRRHADTGQDTDLPGALGHAGDVLLHLDRFAEAEPLLREAYDGWRAIMPEHRLTALAGSELGECLAKLDRLAEAEPLLLASESRLRLEFSNDKPATQQPVLRVIALYEAWNQPEKAKAWRQKFDSLTKAAARRDSAPAATSTAPAGNEP